MQWDIPPLVKVYEAWGAIADGRVQMNSSLASVRSSSGNKEYAVSFDPETRVISSNDNASYYVGYLGYPALVFLMLNGILERNDTCIDAFKEIAWKDIAQQFSNDWDAVQQQAEELASKRGVSAEMLRSHAQAILSSLAELNLQKPSRLIKPPSGY